MKKFSPMEIAICNKVYASYEKKDITVLVEWLSKICTIFNDNGRWTAVSIYDPDMKVGLVASSLFTMAVQVGFILGGKRWGCVYPNLLECLKYRIKNSYMSIN